MSSAWTVTDNQKTSVTPLSGNRGGNRPQDEVSRKRGPALTKSRQAQVDGSKQTILVEYLFRVVERTLAMVNSPGGRILMLWQLVLMGYFGAWLGLPEGTTLGRVALIALLVTLARNPKAPGLLETLSSLLVKNQR